ncbi:MAG TPA: bifunctional serine/threonine-protein kinase/formylglycine-generating enzyme family protein [Gemmataceae bacterium]|nr:bifunctional serine/threonine-protein kinase/formylglycine-generating enzyme family protein [Gemmataceae bacterium]
MRTSPSTPCPAPDQLRAYHQGRVSDGQLADISAHLKGCPACLRDLDRLDRSEAPLIRRGSSAFAPNDLSDPALASAVRRLLSPTTPTADRPADPLLPGDRLGEYRLLEQIGEGGMGTTYKALHARLERVVALKVLRPPLARDPTAVARFHREMLAIGRLQHPNIVHATDAGEARGLLYLVMEYVPGENLSRRVRRLGALPVEEAGRVIRAAARGLHHAHERGLVHRDVKPSNLILAEDGTVKVLDLGLALLHQPVSGDGTAEPTQLSAERGVIGTNDYMAPEQWRNSSKVDARADQYSLGCTLYYLLTGEPPFARHTGGTHYEKMEAHLTRPAPDPSGSRPEVPAELDAVVRRMLAKAPADRFGSMAGVIDALAPFAGDPDSGERATLRPPARPRRRGWLAAAAVVLVAAALVALWRPLFGTPIPDPPIDPPAPVVKTQPPPGRLPMTADEARAVQARWADFLDRPVAERNTIGMDLVLIPPGEYQPEPGSQVAVTQPYDLGGTEVTHGQFDRFVAETGYQPASERGGGHVFVGDGRFEARSDRTWRAPGTHEPTADHPVVTVGWEDASKFCEWLTRREGRKYRLPTEWEWQWACRAGSDQRFFFGSDPGATDDYAWHARNSERTSVRPVGRLRPNAWGLYDILGNASEWALNYRTTLPGGRTTDPRGVRKGKGKGEQVIACGGNYDTDDPFCHHRLTFTPNIRWHKIGFRVLREHSAHVGE